MRQLIPMLLLICATSDLLAQQGRVGIQTASPEGVLHVVGDSPTNGPKSASALAIFDSNDEAYIQLSSAVGIPSGILSGDRFAVVRSGMIFQGDSSILFKSGGDTTRLILDRSGRLGLNTSDPAALLHVSNGDVVYTAPYALPAIPSPPPVSGPGSRMMWYPDRAAFRSGGVSATHWDSVNIGSYSSATGFNTRASGFASTALGVYGKASGSASTTLGSSGSAIGTYSLACNWVMAKAYACVAFGSYNDTSATSTTQWVPSDPLFVIGNGINHTARNNALTVLKNGRTGINTAHPSSIFHVVRGGPSGAPQNNFALATFESNDQSYIQLSQPSQAESGILSGNEQTIIRSALVFGIDSSMMLRTGGNSTRLFLDKTGKLGINTQSPQALLHIRRSGASGGTFHPSAIANLESSGHGFLQFSQKNNAEAGILSGNEHTIIRSALIFGIDSSMMFRSGGNNTRMFLDKAGKFGINTLAPEAPIHIKQGNGSLGPKHPQTLAIFESSENAYIQLSQPTGKSTGILSGNSVADTRSGILFHDDNSLRLYAGGSNVRMTIQASGNVGINTVNPATTLDVNGQFKLGADGTSCNAMIRLTIPLNVPSIPAFSTYTETIPHGPVSTSATIMVSPGDSLPDGIIIAYACSSNDEIYVKFTNATGASIDPPNNTYHITIIQ